MYNISNLIENNHSCISYKKIIQINKKLSIILKNAFLTQTMFEEWLHL